MRRTVMMSGWAMALAGACGPGPRQGVGVDAGEGCGDGVIQRYQSDGVSLKETCDDGPLNGTTESLCDLDCLDQQANFQLLETVQLPVPARKLMAPYNYDNLRWLIASNFDDRGIALVAGDTVQLVKAYSAPTDFTIGLLDDEGSPATWELEVVWLERGVSGADAPRLFWAALDAESVPIIHELPFPVPTATQAVFQEADMGLSADTVVMAVVADGREYLVRMHRPLANGGWTDVTEIGPAPAGELRLAVSVLGDELDSLDAVNRIAGFFGIGPTSVVVAKYELFELSLNAPTFDYAAIWPTGVLSGDDGRYTPATILRTQLAVLAPDGTVDVWDFNHAPSEIEPTYFGRMPEGTRQIASVMADPGVMANPGSSVMGIVNDGSIAFLANNGAGRGLAMQRLPVGPPCDVCTIGASGNGDNTPQWIALDDVAMMFRFGP